MSISVGFTILNNLTPKHARSFADGDHSVVARVAFLVLHYQLGESLGVERHFGDECTIHSRKIGTDQAGFTTISAEQFDVSNAFMRPGTCSKLVNKLNASS